MSYNNPTVNEVISNSVDKFGMHPHLCKSYLNLAKCAFYKKQRRKANIEDSQALFDEFVLQWKHWYITRPLLRKLHREKATPVWKFGCSIRISVKDSTREFVRSINPTFKNVFEYYYDSWIVRYGMLEEYKKFAKENLDKFPYYPDKTPYTDWSHMAFNNITDDF